MKEENKELLRTFCKYWNNEFNCKPCHACPIWGLLWTNDRMYERGWSLQQAIRHFGRTSLPDKDARKILEEKMGMPLDIVHMVLREIKDYEENKDCHDA